MSYLEFEKSIAHSFEGSDRHIKVEADFYSLLFSASPVLDLGSGRGIFLESLSEQSINATGIDNDESLVYDTSNRTQFGSILDSHDFNEFGGVSLIHVIEHFHPNEILRALYPLKNNTTVKELLIVTPNFAEANVGLCNFWLDTSHVRPYPLPLLKAIVENLGFTVKYSGYRSNNYDSYVFGERD